MKNVFEDILEFIEQSDSPEESLQFARSESARLSFEEKSDIYDDIGYALFENGNYRYSITFWNEALEIYLQNEKEYEFSIVSTRINMGMAFDRTGYYREAISHLEVGLGILEKTTYADLIIPCLSGLASAFQSLGDYSMAMEYVKQAEDALTFLKDPALEARILTQKGSIYTDIGDYPKGKDCQVKVLEIIAGFNDKLTEGACYTNLGNIAEAEGDSREALRCFRKAMVCFQVDGSRTDIADCHTNIGIS
ncbi:MAG: tetratricopeptide repeat protein, partial [bacterium]|nr:tetratricopeptide repeat protein [bacterium]